MPGSFTWPKHTAPPSPGAATLSCDETLLICLTAFEGICSMAQAFSLNAGCDSRGGQRWDSADNTPHSVFHKLVLQCANHLSFHGAAFPCGYVSLASTIRVI